MVSSSRKKNKGRDRKAKKVEAERARVRNIWLEWATGEDKTGNKLIQCNHGRGVTIPDDLDHPVSRFLNDFITYRNSNRTEYTTGAMMSATLKTHPQVWHDDRYRELVVSIFTSMGVNYLLSNEDTKCVWALRIAKGIVMLEHYNGTDSFTKVVNSRGVATKIRDLGSPTNSSRRDTLKFFAKRVSCSCLKKMHHEARNTILKTGSCMNCSEEMERVALSVCSRCMIMQYCSRECQVADWSTHRKECDIYARAHKQRTQVADENGKDE